MSSSAGQRVAGPLVVGEDRPDVVVIMTDEERAAPPYESDELADWRRRQLPGERWFADHAVSFDRHYTGSLACVPSRPTLFTGQYPDVHGVTQTDGLGKTADDSRLRWLRKGEVPTLGNWFRAGGYDTHYDGKWHISHADLIDTDGTPLATNDAQGVIDQAAVAAYLDADPLAPFGFSGWVGPEPHGGALGNAGVRRDELIADRVVAWLQNRYARRRRGDADALRPFLLVASFVNPHDIVLFPLWINRGEPLVDAPHREPPPVGPSPTDAEDLSSKPAAQAAYRAAYPSMYGPAAAVAALYADNEQRYRDLYYRLHAEVDGPVDRVRQTVTDGGSSHAVVVRTSDHGELLGAHGGLHQKWFNLYDEATRIPFHVARIADGAVVTDGSRVVDDPSSHVDVVPTLLDAAGLDEASIGAQLATSFTEVHPLPGASLLDVVDGAPSDAARAVYMLTRDNICEGDTGASAVARAAGQGDDPPPELMIHVPADVGANFEGIVARSAIDGRLYKLVRTFDDPATWTEPGRRHLASVLDDGTETYRREALADQWELYDLDGDAIELTNLADGDADDVFDEFVARLAFTRRVSVPARHESWPYASRRASAS